MLAREKNEIGVISLDEGLVRQIIDHALVPYEGKVWIANYKGPSSDTLIRLGGYDAIEELEIKNRGGGIYVRIFLILSFGLSIRSTCIDIISDIVKDISECLQLPVDDVELKVTGVVSKRIARRDINYSYKGLKVSEEINRGHK